MTPTDGPAPSPSGTALTAMANNTSQATTPSQSSSATVVTPRKGIEAALLSHLQYVTPTDAGVKRVRIKRTHTDRKSVLMKASDVKPKRR